MNDVAIRVEKLGKRYQIGARREKYLTLRESLVQAVGAPIRRLRNNGERPSDSHIWALKDVSLEIKQGQVVGVIGRNGAGKSTLLRILSRITEPSEGWAEIRGRVGSLLGIDTGFHQELTGRENIYLSGAILGMKKRQIDRKFDEIVDFAEVDRFLDTPVKRYSSGMYIRLAFAVAAHLEPEILLVDEVLAVGDVAFQEKCLGRMGEVAREGRTVLFVSHHLDAIQTLCPQCLLLVQGRLVAEGDSRTVVAKYLSTGVSIDEWVAKEHGSGLGNPYFDPLRFCIVDGELNPVSREVSAHEKFGVCIEGFTEQLSTALIVGFALYSSSGQLLFQTFHTDVEEEKWPPIKVGRNRLVAWIPEHFLNEGNYRVELVAYLHHQDWISQPGANAPSIDLCIRGGLSRSPYWTAARPGLLAPIIPLEAVTIGTGGTGTWVS